MNETLTIISFDHSPDAAQQEQREDRSLNLLLRQQRIRSEIFRVPLAPSSQDDFLLQEVFEHSRQRRVVFLARDVDRHPEQRALIAKLAAFATQAVLVTFGLPIALWPELPSNIEYYAYESDSAENIAALASCVGA